MQGKRDFALFLVKKIRFVSDVIFLYYCIVAIETNMSKQLYTLEFPVRCSPTILYDFLSTAAGLSEWFADKVDERDGVFYFGWDGNVEQAEVLEKEQDKFIRYRWEKAAKGEYFEFAIDKSEITNQTILVIKDFAEKKEIKDQTLLWDHQVRDLFHRLGN
jgi:uncharacterized protein YndB with AHSA1/START domain